MLGDVCLVERNLLLNLEGGAANMLSKDNPSSAKPFSCAFECAGHY
jgi:hypothetical protein